MAFVLCLSSDVSIFWCVVVVLFFFFKQKTAYEMRISDWSSDVCSSDLEPALARQLCDALDVGDAQRRVGDHLDQQQLRLGPERGGHRLRIGRIDQRRLEAEARQLAGQQPEAAAVELVAGNAIGSAYGRERRGQYV